MRGTMPLELRTSEWIALGFFLYLTAAAFLTQAPSARKRRVVARAIGISAFIVTMALSGRSAAAARDWLPVLYLPLGYWLPALLVTSTNPTLESRLLSFDRRLFGDNGLARSAIRAPRPLAELLEFAYLMCYPAVPAGLLWLVLGGFPEQADRFWTAVLLAGFCCYGLLPWLPTRPPRALQQTWHSRSSIRSFNLWILDRASVQLNTFPSGHTAASLATALVVGAQLPLAGAALGAIALGIAVGSVVGGYHYAADAISGAAVAVAAFALSAVLV
jgi:membrane-associated phospholipid phosphatase